MTSVLIKKGKIWTQRQTHTEERQNEDKGECYLQTKEHLRLPEVRGEACNRFSPMALRRSQACQQRSFTHCYLFILAVFSVLNDPFCNMIQCTNPYISV